MRRSAAAIGIVRAARPTDAAALARLRYEFRAGLVAPGESKAAFVRRCRSWMAARLARGSAWRCWVIERGGELLGQAWLLHVEKIPNPGAEPEHHAYISNVYVRTAYRGRGLGGRLLEACLAWSRTHDVASVLLWPTRRSRSLYARFGFRDSRRLWERPARGGGVRRAARPARVQPS